MMLLATFTATIYATVAIANVVEAMHEVENVVKDALRMVIQGKLITLKLVNFNHFSGVSNAAVTQTARTIAIVKLEAVIRITRSKTARVIAINAKIQQDHRTDACME